MSSEISSYGEAASLVTQANTITANTQDSTQVAALTGGGFVMVWRDVSGTAASGPDIRAQIFDAGGAKVGGEFLVNTILTTNVAVPAVAGTPDGGFVVSWSDQTNGIRARVFSSTGAAATAGEVTVQDSNAGTVGQTSVATLANGSYMIAWGVTGTPVGGVTPRDVHAKIYDVNGNVVAADFIVSSSTDGNQGVPRVAAVGTSFVVTWTDDRTVGGQNVGQEVLAQRFDASGGRLGAEINVDGGAALNQSNAAITTLADGSFEIVWRNSNGTTTGDTLSAQHFAADGTPLGSAQDVSGLFYYNSGFSFSGTFQAPAIVADAQGGFIVSWVATTVSGGTSYSQIVAQQFDSNGGWLGEPNALVNVDISPKSGVAAARLTSGLIVNSWATSSPALPAQGVDAQFQLYEVYQRINGTAAADTLTNSSGKKAAIDGGDGNDTIYGHGGDQVDGGDDNDTITVDGAHATIYGGQGDDIINGVSDQVFGGEGNDQIHMTGTNAAEAIVLDGGDGDDVITADGNYSAGIFINGDAGNDTLTGSFGNDFLIGGDGDDRLIGRGGADTLVGGLGDDIYTINNAVATIIENANEGDDTIKTSVSYTLASGLSIENLRALGSANINITGNSDHQILVGNEGDNVLDDGGAGTFDRMKGGYGNDTYIVRNAGDVIVELSDSGTNDVVKAAVSFTLGADAWVEQLQTIDKTATTAIDLSGNSHSHDIQGNAGANTLTGGSGADVLQGFGGNDTLVGGGGADVFIFDLGTGQDRVSDFVSGADKIDLTNFGFANFAAVQAATHDVGGSAVIDLGGGNSVTLSGVQTAQLQSGDVILAGGGGHAAEAPDPSAHAEGAVIGIAAPISDDLGPTWGAKLWAVHTVDSPFGHLELLPIF